MKSDKEKFNSIKAMDQSDHMTELYITSFMQDNSFN